jgi:ABC-type multidrug transport system ATPase subunit
MPETTPELTITAPRGQPHAAGPPAAEGPVPEGAVRARQLVKTYRVGATEVTAVRGIDLDIAPGELFGLIGPNGAGKSTTIGMLNTLITPTAGRAWVSGAEVSRDPLEVRRRCAVIGQHNSVDRELSIAENLEFSGRYGGLSRRQARARADELLGLFGLAGRRDALAMYVSGGQLRRLVIARALMLTPQVLFLDEPTAGIDPQARIELWEHLRQLRGSGLTMLLTTHYLEEAEELCDRVAIIDHGAVLACGTVADLRATGSTVVTVTFDRSPPAGAAELLARPGTVSATAGDRRVQVITSRPDGLIAEQVAAGSRAGSAVVDVATVHPSLQGVYLALTGKSYDPGRRQER